MVFINVPKRTGTWYTKQQQRQQLRRNKKKHVRIKFNWLDGASHRHRCKVYSDEILEMSREVIPISICPNSVARFESSPLQWSCSIWFYCFKKSKSNSNSNSKTKKIKSISFSESDSPHDSVHMKHLDRIQIPIEIRRCRIKRLTLRMTIMISNISTSVCLFVIWKLGMKLEYWEFELCPHAHFKA